MRTLHLTLKKKWFDMIASGEKTEEYREIKSYWMKRLLSFPYVNGVINPCESAIKFDSVTFKNGYSTMSPTITLEFLGLEIGIGKPEWGAPAEEVFIIKLGKILTP